MPATHVEIPGVVDTTIDGKQLYNAARNIHIWIVSWTALCGFAALFGQIVFCCRNSTAMLLFVIMALALIGIDGFFLYHFMQASPSILNFEDASLDKLKAELVDNYDHSSAVPQLMDMLHGQFSCCGFEGYRDWHGRVPASCCTNVAVTLIGYTLEDFCEKDLVPRRPGCGEIIRYYQKDARHYHDVVLGVIAGATGAHALLAIGGGALIYLFLREYMLIT